METLPVSWARSPRAPSRRNYYLKVYLAILLLVLNNFIIFNYGCVEVPFQKWVKGTSPKLIRHRKKELLIYYSMNAYYIYYSSPLSSVSNRFPIIVFVHIRSVNSLCNRRSLSGTKDWTKIKGVTNNVSNKTSVVNFAQNLF